MTKPERSLALKDRVPVDPQELGMERPGSMSVGRRARIHRFYYDVANSEPLCDLAARVALDLGIENDLARCAVLRDHLAYAYARGRERGEREAPLPDSIQWALNSGDGSYHP